MTFQAYLDNVMAKIGKTPDDFRQLAAQNGLSQYQEIMAWLKSVFGLGYGHTPRAHHAPGSNRRGSDGLVETSLRRKLIMIAISFVAHGKQMAQQQNRINPLTLWSLAR
jgi:hypothetical protein